MEVEELAGAVVVWEETVAVVEKEDNLDWVMVEVEVDEEEMAEV